MQPQLAAQHSFNRGEISPDLHGRKDWAPIYSGLAVALNVIARTTGGVAKAPGTIFIAPALEQDRPVRFIPFEFGSEQTYVLEFGDRRFRILHRGGLVKYPQGHAKEGEIVVLDSPFTIDQMQSDDIRVERGKRNVDYCQDNDTLIIVHGESKPKILTRFDHHDWRWTDFTAETGLPYPTGLIIEQDGGKGASYCVATLGTNNAQSSASNTVTCADDGGDGITVLSWTPAEGATGYRVYKRFPTTGGMSYQAIGDVNGNTFIDNNTESGDEKQTPVEPTNPFDGPGKYPSVAMFHGSRLVMGGPTEKPNRINGSKLGEFKNFTMPKATDTSTDEDAFEWSVTGGKSSPILLWLASMADLVMGASAGEYRMKGSRPASNPEISIQSNYGNSSVKPLLFRKAIVSVGNNRESLNAFAFDYLSNDYGGKELTHYSRHIFAGQRIMATAAQPNPFATMWCVLSNGIAAVVTYMAEEEVLGVTRRATDGRFETCESIANIDGRSDIYFQTVRVVNGQERRYLELMAPHHFPGMALDDAWYVDCGLEYQGEAKSTFTGMEHLEGRAIAVLADGVSYGVDGSNDIVVRNGAFTLPVEASHVIAGLPYTAEITTIDMGPQGFEPTSRNRAPIIATVGFHHARDCRYSCEGSDEGRLDFHDPDGQTTSLKTCSKTFTVPADPAGSLSSRLTLRSYSPVPWCVTRADMIVKLADTHNRAH
ncbi:MAG: hypothetical protein LUC93_05660 [Planctomycetaceae bacterium]|nr:hypothetical protein [Planctomycetaceae bacterium]